MWPYTTHEADWLTSGPEAPALTDAMMRYHLRRGEQMRAEAVGAAFAALIRGLARLARRLTPVRPDPLAARNGLAGSSPAR
ncbi:MAG: RSP_7527 family protein [Inquilinaceae bacterium]